jgi:cytochrome c oxidase subunit 2
MAAVDTQTGYRELFDVYWPVGVATLALIWLAMLTLVVRYRRRPGAPDPREGERERPRAEGAYVALLAGIGALLVYLTFSTMGRLVSDHPLQASSVARGGVPGARAERVDVTAFRWNWRFDYPARGITQIGTARSIPTLVVPVGDVRFRLTSRDVVHSFFIPFQRFKRDAFPRRQSTFTLGFTRAGFHHAVGECAEFCGVGHAYMQFNVRVLAVAEFDRWVAARRAGRPQELTPMMDRRGNYA